VLMALADADVAVPVLVCAIPQEFPEMGERALVLQQCGLTGQELTRRIVEQVARLEGDVLDPDGVQSRSES